MPDFNAKVKLVVDSSQLDAIEKKFDEWAKGVNVKIGASNSGGNSGSAVGNTGNSGGSGKGGGGSQKSVSLLPSVKQSIKKEYEYLKNAQNSFTDKTIGAWDTRRVGQTKKTNALISKLNEEDRRKADEFRKQQEQNYEDWRLKSVTDTDNKIRKQQIVNQQRADETARKQAIKIEELAQKQAQRDALAAQKQSFSEAKKYIDIMTQMQDAESKTKNAGFSNSVLRSQAESARKLMEEVYNGADDKAKSNISKYLEQKQVDLYNKNLIADATAAQKAYTKEIEAQAKSEQELVKQRESYRIKAAKTSDKDLKDYYNGRADEYYDKIMSTVISKKGSGEDISAIRNYYREQEAITNSAIEEYNAQQQARENIQIRSQEYKNIVSQQQRINQLSAERAKYTSNSDKYDAYTKAISAEEEKYGKLVENYGEMSKMEQMRLDTLRAEGQYRVQNMALRDQADKYDKDIATYGLKAFWNDNSKIVAKYGDEVEKVNEAMENATTGTEIKYAQKMRDALYARASAEGNTGLTLVDRFKNSFKGLGVQVGAVVAQFLSIRTAIQLGKEMLNNVVQIDTAMTELRKVTNNSEKEYSDYREQVKQTAYEIGSTQRDLITSTATFARLGYNLNDSAQLGKYAALYASVGDEGMTADDAATYMVSIMKGFSIAADDSKHIIDSLNEVGNNFSISSTGLGESLQRSGAALATGQNSFEEAIGLTVAANDATQNAASTGTALKTITLRLRGAKTELEDAGEDTEGMATSTAKLRDSLKALAGVDILENGNTFKSTFQIMRELANVWEDLSDMNQAAIIEQVAGKRGASFFSSMMKNWEDAENAYQTALNSEGSAEKENESILDSIEGRITRLKSSFESLSSDVISTDLVKGLVTGTDKAIQGLDKVVGVAKGNLLTQILFGGGTFVAGSLATTLYKSVKGVTKTFKKSLLGLIAEKDIGFTGAFGLIGEQAGEEFSKSSLASIGKIFKNHPVLTGVAASIGVVAAAYALWDKNTEQYAESQQKVANNLQNYNSAITQTKTIQEEIVANEKTIAELESSGNRTLAVNAQIAALKQQNNLLKLQKEYQESIAKTSQVAAASAAQTALSNQNAYFNNGKSTSEGSGKFLSFLLDIGTAVAQGQYYSSTQMAGIGQGYTPSKLKDEFTISATEAFDSAIERYQEAKDAFMRVDASDQDAYTAANTEYAEALTNLNTFVTDYQNYSAVLVDENGNVVQGFEKTYDEVKTTLNKASYAINGKESFAKTLIAQYDGAEEAFLNKARKGGLTTEFIKDNFGGLAEEAEAVGLSLNYITNAFNEAAQGGKNFVSLTSDNLDDVNTKITELETIIENVAKAASEGFGVSGLSRSAYNVLGENYRSAMMYTGSGGIRLNYEEYQQKRSVYANKGLADISNEIRIERGVIRDTRKNIAEQQKIIEENQAVVDSIQKNGIQSDYDLARLREASANINRARSNISNLTNDIGVSQNNIENLKVARIELQGLSSDVAQYIATVDGAYSQTQTVDAIAKSFKDLFESVEEDGKKSSAQAREFMELYTGKDLSGVSNADVGEYWDKAKKNFLLYNDEVKDSNDNITGYEFNATKAFDAIKKAGEDLNKAFVDTNGNIKVTSSDVLTLAKSFGISEDAVESMILALSDYGHDVEITDTLQSFGEFARGNKKVSFDKYGITTGTSRQNYSEYKEAYGDKKATKKIIKDQQKHIKQLQSAREQASAAGNTEDLAALDNRMVAALLTSERMGRSSSTNNFMWSKTSNMTGNEKTVATYLKQLQNAREKLSAATTAREDYGIDINVDELKGDVANAEDAIADYIKSISSLEGVDLSNLKIDKDSTLDEIREQIADMDVGELFSSLGTTFNLGDVEVVNADELAQNIATSISDTKAALDAKLGEGNYKLNIDAQGNITGVTVDPSVTPPPVEMAGEIDTSGAQEAVDSVEGKEVDIGVDASGAVAGAGMAFSAIEEVPESKDTRFVGIDAGLTHLANYAASYPAYQEKNIVFRFKTIGSVPSVGGGGADYNGTAHYSGSAYANGSNSWGAKGGPALVGEVNPELMVYNNRWQIIGKHGAEMRNIPSGAIIFNGEQTEQIMKNGHTSYGGGRGKVAHYSGTAYADGTDFDFIETYLNRGSRRTSNLDALTERVANTNGELRMLKRVMASVKDEINRNTSAYSTYMSKAASVGLSEEYASKVRDGSLDITTITDENLAKKISKYKEYYEAALSCKDAIIELTNREKELWRNDIEAIQNASNAYREWREAIIDTRSSRNDLYVERNGRNSVSLLKSQRNSYGYIMERLESDYNKMTKEFNEQVKNGVIKPRTARWHEAKKAIYELKTAINETALAIEELNNKIRETNWQKYENALGKLDSTDNQLSSLQSVFETLDAFTDSGKITNAGKTQFGILASSLANSRQQIADYNVALKALKKEYDKGIINEQEYAEQVQEVREQQLAAVSSANSYRQSILKLVEDGINKETEAMEKLINARKEALNKQKESDNYAKDVADKTKQINSIQAQIAALSGDDSLANRAKIKALQDELKTAQDSLEETQKEREFTLINEALDEELKDFKETQDEKIAELNKSLKLQNQAVKDALEIVKDDYRDIYKQLKSAADEYGITLDKSIRDPWYNGTLAIREYNKAVKSVKPNTSIKTNNYKKKPTKKAASGAKNIGGLVLTNEEGLGSEAIITKAGALMQLDAGSTVFSKDQTDLLWSLSKLPISTIAGGQLSGGVSFGNIRTGDVNMHYDSLLTVNGNVDKEALPNLEEILKKASERTRKDIFATMRKQGLG